MGEPERHSDRMTNAEVMAYAKGAAAGAFLALEPRVGDEAARTEAKWIAATAVVNLLAESDTQVGRLIRKAMGEGRL